MGDAAEIVMTDDIGVVAVTSDTQNEEMTLYNAVIIGVSHLDAHRACLQCKTRVEPLTPPFGRCSKPECKMLHLCVNHTTAKLMLMHQVEGQNKVIQVHAFGKYLEQIVGDGECYSGAVTESTTNELCDYSENQKNHQRSESTVMHVYYSDTHLHYNHFILSFPMIGVSFQMENS